MLKCQTKIKDSRKRRKIMTMVMEKKMILDTTFKNFKRLDIAD